MKSAPAWLRRHPALLVEWLRLFNAWSRWRDESRHGALLVLSAAAAILMFVSLWRYAAAATPFLAEYWVMLALLATTYGATSVSSRRRQLEESASQSWLIATPISPRSLVMTHAIRALWPLFALAVAALMLPVLVAITTEAVAPAAGIVATAAAGGLTLGGIVGWLATRRSEPSMIVPSRYVPRPRRRGGMRPDTTALARWPIMQVLAWSRPENSRYVLIAALLAVQGGSSAIAGLSVVAMYFVASYLAALLSAMTTVARLAAAWLRTTPMTLTEFIWSVSRLALAHQFVATALAVACMLFLGAPFGMALQIAALWLGLFVSISGFALIDNYRNRSPWVKIAMSIATVAALATLLQIRAGAKS